MIAPDIVRLSPNFAVPLSPAIGPTGQLVIIHATRSGKFQNPTEFDGTINWFLNPLSQVSSHWVISRTGVKARVVQDNDLAWHAGIHNTQAWGIELEQSTTGEGFTDVQLEALVEVCKGYRDDFGVAPVHTLDIHQSGFIGHEETPQGRSIGKSDPGFLFPWDQFIQALQPVAIPTNEEISNACLAGAYFTLRGWNVTDLSTLDKTALRHLVSLLGE